MCLEELNELPLYKINQISILAISKGDNRYENRY